MAVFRPYAKGKMSIAGVDEAYVSLVFLSSRRLLFSIDW
jgi:hypothetical protein